MTHQHISALECSLYGTCYEANASAADFLISSTSKRLPILSSLESIASLSLGLRTAISEPDFGLLKYSTAAGNDPFWQSTPIKTAHECHVLASNFWGCGACLYVAAKLLNNQLTETGVKEVRFIIDNAKSSDAYKDNFNLFLDDPLLTMESAQRGLRLFCDVFLAAEIRGEEGDFAFSSRILEAPYIKEPNFCAHTQLAFKLLREDYSAVLGVFDDFQSCLKLIGLPLRKK